MLILPLYYSNTVISNMKHFTTFKLKHTINYHKLFQYFKEIDKICFVIHF